MPWAWRWERRSMASRRDAMGFQKIVWMGEFMV
jgi:hypothetical protein